MKRERGDAVERQRTARSAKVDPRQLGMFEPPAPHVPGSDTSRAAALSQTKTQAARLRRGLVALRVLRFLAACKEHGATTDEMDAQLPDIGDNTLRPVIIGHRDKGFVLTPGRTRMTRKRCAAEVHFITPEGHAYLARQSGR